MRTRLFKSIVARSMIASFVAISGLTLAGCGGASPPVLTPDPTPDPDPAPDPAPDPDPDPDPEPNTAPEANAASVSVPENGSVAIALTGSDADGDALTFSIVTQPTHGQLPVARYYTPDEFVELRDAALAMGFRHVESGPFVRSSYHAKQHVEDAPVSKASETSHGSVSG